MTSILSKLNPTPYFPAYKGPYEVGTIDVELPVSMFTDSGLSPPCPSHTDIPTLQFRVFYPAALRGQATGTQGGATWLPSPRREYVAAYCRFLGASDYLANILSYIPRLLYYIKIPAYVSHPLLQSSTDNRLPREIPTVVFSHGLGGSRNTYSYLTASIASQGAVVFSIEHRDGSGPTTFIREPKTKSGLAALPKAASGLEKIQVDGVPQTPSSSGSDDELDQAKPQDEGKPVTDDPAKRSTWNGYNRQRIDYKFQKHEISPDTAAMRNKQLEIRTWELGVLFAAIQRFQSGWADADVDEDLHIGTATKDVAGKKELLEMFKGRLDVERPGSIIWSGHSFGAATTTQFLKSVWYRPKFQRSSDYLKEPLYVPSDSLLKHFHPDGVVSAKSKAPTTVLLDPWCLPLLGARTRPMWTLPLPGPTMAILSQQFARWKDNLRGVRHVLNLRGGVYEDIYAIGDPVYEDPASGSSTPGGGAAAAADETIPQDKKLQRSSSMNITPQLPAGISQEDEAKLEENVVDDDNSPRLEKVRSNASYTLPGQPDRKLYYTKTSAHLSQSDFGILFPKSAKYLGKVDDSEGILDLNVRAISEFLRENGANVAPFGEGEERDKQIFGDELVNGWEILSLELGDEGKMGKVDEGKVETVNVGEAGMKKESSRL